MRFLVILILSLFLFNSFSQSNSGTDFWMGFMKHRDGPVDSKVLMIASKVNTSGTIEVPGLSINIPFTVIANNVTLVSLSPMYNNVEVLSSEVIEKKGIHIIADAPVVVYAHQYAWARSEAALILPTEVLANKYYAMCYNADASEAAPSEFLIVAVEDTTLVNITPAYNTISGKPANTVFSVVLNKGETYQVQSTITGSSVSAPDDLTGSYIEADKKIAVFAGSAKSNVGGCCCQDNIFEQMYPTQSWGKEYLLVPTKDKIYDLIRIMPLHDSTDIYIDTTLIGRYNVGQFYETNINKAAYVYSCKPILVAQYIVGRDCGGGIGDPAMVLLNPVEQTIDSITFYSSSFQNINRNYVNIVTKTIDTNFIKLDDIAIGNLFDTVEFKPDYSFAQILVSTGVHNITTDSGSGFLAIAYGLSYNVESYMYSAGANFKNIVNLNIQTGNLNNPYALPNSGCVRDTLFFSGESGDSIDSYYWDFGDGSSIDSIEAPKHVYVDTGNYTVLLRTTIILDCGGFDTLETYKTINIGEIDTVDFSLQDICIYDTLRLIDLSDVKNDSVIMWNWDLGNGNIDSLQNPNYVYGDTGSYNIRLNIFTQYGCFDTSSIKTVSVYPIPVFDALGDTTICVGDTVEIGNMLTNGNSYSWNPADKLLNPDSSFTLAFPDSTTLYKIKVTEPNNNCSSIDSVFIVVNMYPNSFLGNDTTIFIGDCIDLIAGDMQYEYRWMPNDWLDNDSTYYVVSCPESTITYFVEIETNNCITNDYITIKVLHEYRLEVPSAFSPNSDLNSTIFPILAGIKELLNFKVYNRWGQLMFETTTAGDGWGGRFKDIEQEMGAYYYMASAITVNGNQVETKGYFVLIR